MLVFGWLAKTNLRCHISFSRIPCILVSKIISDAFLTRQHQNSDYIFAVFQLGQAFSCVDIVSFLLVRFHSVINVVGKHVIPLTRYVRQIGLNVIRNALALS